jgi:hypothetical protein
MCVAAGEARRLGSNLLKSTQASAEPESPIFERRLSRIKHVRRKGICLASDSDEDGLGSVHGQQDEVLTKVSHDSSMACKNKSKGKMKQHHM